MKAIRDILVITAVLLSGFVFYTGCDGNGGHQARPVNVKPESVTSARFKGQIKGCQEHWDEFFCGKRGTLNSNSAVIRDANGTPVVVDRGRK